MIHYKHGRLHILKEKENDIKIKIKNLCEEEEFKILENRIVTIGKIEYNVISNRQNKKLKYWLRNNPQKLKMLNKTSNEIDYINLSSKQMNTHQDSVLKLGPKYILDDNINLKDTIPKIENALDAINTDQRDKLRSIAQEVIKKGLKEKTKDVADRKCLNEIKNDENLACLMTDKTGKIVIMDKADYVNKMETTIQEMEIENITQNPLNKLIGKVKLLLQSKYWPDDKKPTLLNHAPNIPRMFGKFKDHKIPPKMRPIVNKSEGPTYEIEKYMKNIYNKLLPPSTHSLSSTSEFIQRLREFSSNQEYILVSFDVINLFPSIDIQEIQNNINSIIECSYNREIVTTLIQASNLILNESYFKFNEKIYKQLKGVPMGSPIASSIAEFKLRNLENKILEINKDKIFFWVRYVYDVHYS